MDHRMPPPPTWNKTSPLARAPNSLGLEMGSAWSLTPVLTSHLCSRAKGEVSHFFFFSFQSFLSKKSG